MSIKESQGTSRLRERVAPVRTIASSALLWALFAAAPLSAQTGGTTPPPMDHSKMTSMMAPDPLGVPMMRAGSGTTWVPDAVQLPTYMFMKGKWDLMLHGFAFAQYNVQGGDRGDKQFGALNWGMFMASRGVKGGRFQLRTMFSIDAATIGPRGYPLLAQAGETYNGVLVRDRQHPHDFFMEVGATYEKPITDKVGLSLYAAPSGEPALGPVAFMHRPSSMDLPLAPLGHHWQDATHVAFGVLSAGIFTNKIKLEASTFNGREPNQHRWDFDRLALDSYSARLTVNPTRNWSLTAGYGYLDSPESLHPEESVNRIVASAIYGKEIGSDGQLSATLVFGQNKHKEGDEEHTFESHLTASFRDVAPLEPSDISNSILLEAELMKDRRNTFFGRYEAVQKTADELEITGPNRIHPVDPQFTVHALSLGYVREVATLKSASFGIGAMGTANLLPENLKYWYGTNKPLGGVVFARVRPVFKRAAAPAMNHVH